MRLYWHSMTSAQFRSSWNASGEVFYSTAHLSLGLTSMLDNKSLSQANLDWWM